MKKLHIFIETSVPTSKRKVGLYTNEYYFVEQYLRFLIPEISESDYDITDVGGKDKLRMFDNAMKQNTEDGDVNLVIFDSDEPATGGGFKSRCDEINSLKSELGIDFSLFLFPNDKDDGAFENLLLNIVNPKHKGILECFKGYEMCLRGHDPDERIYETPNRKAEIYSYITTFKHSRKQRERIKGGDWDFCNTEYWCLDTPYVEPLKEFLMEHV